MNKELVFVSVYPSFTEMFEEICWEGDYPYTIIDARREDAIIALKRRFPKNFPEVVISRGITADFIDEAYHNTIVVRAEPDDTDLLYGLNKAKNIGNRIGYLSHNREKYLEKTLLVMKDVLSLDELRLYTYDSENDVESSVMEAKNSGIEVIVGVGLYGSEVATKHHLANVFIETGKRALWKAVNRALDILEFLEKEKKQNLRFRTLVNAIKEGVIATKNSKITIINPAAEKIFNVYSESMVGKKIDELNPMISEYIKNNNVIDDIISIGESNFLIDKIIKENSHVKETMVLLHDVTQIEELEKKTRTSLYAKGLVAKYKLKDFIGESMIIKDLICKTEYYAKTDANILITGESGTGKEIIAQGIHNASKRKNMPFVAVNCAELPEQLLESELFGYTEGSFTGAKKGGKIGLIELAHKGTIFLDEINSTTISLQSKLLRVVQEKELRKIGSDNIIPVDIRVIAAINKEIGILLSEQVLREDLFYRLSTLTLHVPPLRERREDIPLLAEHFREVYNKNYQKKVPCFNQSVYEKLMNFEWYGNVRELENVIHRYIILYDNEKDNSELITNCMDNTFQSDLKKFSTFSKDSSNIIKIRKSSMHEMEKEIINIYLKDANGNMSIAANRLGIGRTTLWRRLKETEILSD